MNTEIKLDRRSFLAGLGGALAAAIPGCNSTPAAETPRSSLPTGSFGDIDEKTVFDVCIIGSGFAGAVLGEALARHGIKTVILESGPDPRKKSIDPRLQTLIAFKSSGPIEYPVTSSRFRGLGGTSWLWGGLCTRLHPSDFEKSAYLPGGASWPINYNDLQPFYQRAEEVLRVRGGRRSKYHPPRSKAYPFPPDRSISPRGAK